MKDWNIRTNDSGRNIYIGLYMAKHKYNVDISMIIIINALLPV